MWEDEPAHPAWANDASDDEIPWDLDPTYVGNYEPVPPNYKWRQPVARPVQHQNTSVYGIRFYKPELARVQGRGILIQSAPGFIFNDVVEECRSYGLVTSYTNAVPHPSVRKWIRFSVFFESTASAASAVAGLNNKIVRDYRIEVVLETFTEFQKSRFILPGSVPGQPDADPPERVEPKKRFYKKKPQQQQRPPVENENKTTSCGKVNTAQVEPTLAQETDKKLPSFFTHPRPDGWVPLAPPPGWEMEVLSQNPKKDSKPVDPQHPATPAPEETAPKNSPRDPAFPLFSLPFHQSTLV